MWCGVKRNGSSSTSIAERTTRRKFWRGDSATMVLDYCAQLMAVWTVLMHALCQLNCERIVKLTRSSNFYRFSRCFTITATIPEPKIDSVNISGIFYIESINIHFLDLIASHQADPVERKSAPPQTERHDFQIHEDSYSKQPTSPIHNLCCRLWTVCISMTTTTTHPKSKL